MKKKVSGIFVSSTMAIVMVCLSACNSSQNVSSNISSFNSESGTLVSSSKEEYEGHFICFVINGKEETVEFKSENISIPQHKMPYLKFAGWASSNNGEVIGTWNEFIYFNDVNSLFKDSKTIKLYAVYQEIINVTFFKDDGNVFEEIILDKKLGNEVIVPDLEKNGFEFNGWTTNKNSTNVNFIRKTPISYEKINQYMDEECLVKMYPVFTKLNSSIVLYDYSVSEKLPEIRINTENGIALDDPTLIDPTQKKGSKGELAVYKYAKATIGVNSFGEGYDINDATGQVKIRGNYTSTYKKKPLRIKFDSKQKMLGLSNNNKFKSWVLLAEWKDSSLLRNAVANYIGNSLLESNGNYCSDFRFVEVYLNNEYNGVYLLAEQQQIDPNRVNVPESKAETDGAKTGFMIEYDGYYTNEPAIQTFTLNYNGVSSLTNGFTVVNDIMNQDQHDIVKRSMQSIWTVVYNATRSNNPTYSTINENGEIVADSRLNSAFEAISSVVNIDSLIDMYILHEICEDRDIGWSSFYFSLDMSENGNRKLNYVAPWDFDYAIGNNNYKNAIQVNIANQQQMINQGRLLRNGNSYKFAANTELKIEDFTFSNRGSLYAASSENPWFSVFANQKWFYELVAQRWQEAVEAKVFDNAITMIDVYTEKYEDAFNRNFTKWKESMGIKLDGYQPNLVSYFVNQKQASSYLKYWLQTRISYLENGINQKLNSF